MLADVLISLYPDEWRDFHDCSQDVLQSLSEGDQEAPCHVSTYPPWLNDFSYFQKVCPCKPADFGDRLACGHFCTMVASP